MIKTRNTPTGSETMNGYMAEIGNTSNREHGEAMANMMRAAMEGSYLRPTFTVCPIGGSFAVNVHSMHEDAPADLLSTVLYSVLYDSVSETRVAEEAREREAAASGVRAMNVVAIADDR